MESGKSSQGSSRFTAEYDASGQVIITEGGGKFSLRSRSSSDAVSPSVNGPDDVRSLASNGHPRRISDDGSLPTSVALVEQPETPPQTAGSGHYRRRSGDGLEEGPPPPLPTVASDGVGTASTASSSLLRRLGGRLQKRKPDEESSDSDSTTRYSDFSRGQSKRGGGRRRKNRRKKKHKGRSIDKHSDTSSTRGCNASDSYDVGGPDNEYWREMVAEQRRLASLDRGRRRSSNSSPRRRRRRNSEGNKLSVRPPRSNGTSAPASLATGSASQYSGGDSVHRSLCRQSSSTSKVERGCCDCSGSSVVPTVIFVIVGCLLIIVGVIRICICFWHEFGSSVWTGALVSEHILC